jgi:hypothetical protein
MRFIVKGKKYLSGGSQFNVYREVADLFLLNCL